MVYYTMTNLVSNDVFYQKGETLPVTNQLLKYVEITRREYLTQMRKQILQKNSYKLGAISALINIKAAERIGFELLAGKRNLPTHEQHLIEMDAMDDETNFLMTGDETSHQLFMNEHAAMYQFLMDEPPSNHQAKKCLEIIELAIDLIRPEIEQVDGVEV